MLNGLKIGFALTGSHCTIAEVLPYITTLRNEGAIVIPILSASVQNTDTRFGKAEDIIKQILSLAGQTPLMTVTEVEPIGPQKLLDLLLIAPCTGNTLAKLALGITDSTVTLASKAHLRNNRPLVIAVSTNDGLSGNARNLGILVNRKNVYFVPFGQDAPLSKQSSLVAKMNLIPETLKAALQHQQLQPVLITH